MRRLVLTTVVGLCLGLVLAVAACGDDEVGDMTMTSVLATTSSETSGLTAEIVSPTARMLSRAHAYLFDVNVENAVGAVTYEWTSRWWTNDHTYDGLGPLLSDQKTFTRWGSEFRAGTTDTVRVTVRDSEGNTASDEIEVEFTADVPPVVEILSPEDGATFYQSQTISLTGQSFDADSPPDFRLAEGPVTRPMQEWVAWVVDRVGDEDPPFSWSYEATLSGLSVGTHIIDFRGSDNYGAAAEDVITIEILPDPVDRAPNAQILSPSSGASYTANAQDSGGQWYVSVALKGRGTDPEDGTLSGDSLVWTDSVNGGSARVIGHGTALTVRLGAPNTFGNTHKITLTVTDKHGHTAKAVITVTVSLLS